MQKKTIVLVTKEQNRFFYLRFQYDSHAVHSVIGGAASLVVGAGTKEEEEEAGQHSAEVGKGEEREVRIGKKERLKYPGSFKALLIS